MTIRIQQGKGRSSAVAKTAGTVGSSLADDSALSVAVSQSARDAPHRHHRGAEDVHDGEAQNGPHQAWWDPLVASCLRHAPDRERGGRPNGPAVARPPQRVHDHALLPSQPGAAGLDAPLASGSARKPSRVARVGGADLPAPRASARSGGARGRRPRLRRSPPSNPAAHRRATRGPAGHRTLPHPGLCPTTITPPHGRQRHFPIFEGREPVVAILQSPKNVEVASADDGRPGEEAKKR